MTPFAQLLFIEKSGAVQQPPENYEFAVNERSGLRDPYAAYRPAPGTPQARAAEEAAKGTNWGKLGGELALDIGLGWNPFTGIPWFGAKAVNDFAHGRWGSGLANVGFGALSIAGGGSAGAAVKGGSTGIKASMAALKAGKGVRTAANALRTGSRLAPGIRTGLKVGGAGAATVGIGSGVLGYGGEPHPFATPFNPNAYQTPTNNPLSDLKHAMVSAVVNNGMPTQGAGPAYAPAPAPTAPSPGILQSGAQFWRNTLGSNPYAR